MLSVTNINTLQNSLYSPTINPFAQLFFSTTRNKQWKLIQTAIPKHKHHPSGVSTKQDILQWQGTFHQVNSSDKSFDTQFISYYRLSDMQNDCFKLRFNFLFKRLSVEEKISVTVIENEDFIKKFIKFSTPQYQNKLVNFNTGFSILNLLELQVSNDKAMKFNKIKDNIRFALMEEQYMYLQCGTQSKELTGEDIIEWLEHITQNKCFQMAHKQLFCLLFKRITNKQLPQDNMLWFCAQSFSTLQSYLVNEIEKSITKHYFKRETVSNQKLVMFIDYVSKRHPQHVCLLKISFLQFYRMGQQQREQYRTIIKGYQQIYYEDVRRSFIESMESLENIKEMKKKKKQKRKLYKKKVGDNNNDNNDKNDKNDEEQQVVEEKDNNQQDNNDNEKVVVSNNNKDVNYDKDVDSKYVENKQSQKKKKKQKQVVKNNRVGKNTGEKHKYVQKVAKVQQQSIDKQKDNENQNQKDINKDKDQDRIQDRLQQQNKHLNQQLYHNNNKSQQQLNKLSQQHQQQQQLQQLTINQDNNNNTKQQQQLQQQQLPTVIIVNGNNNQPKHQSPQQQTASFLPSQQQTISIKQKKSRNIVYSRGERVRSPYSKSNIVDNQCSKSQLSGEIYQTYTQCVREDYYQQQKHQYYQLFEIDSHPLEVNERHNSNLMNKHHNNKTNNNNNNISNNINTKQIIDMEEQSDRLKKRRKRKNNNTGNTNTNNNINNNTNNNTNKQSSPNNQLSTRIKTHCHNSYTSNLTHFIDHLSIQTNNLYESKIIVFERIRYFIKAFYPQSQIMLYGSNSIGLSLATSDVDVMVLNIKCTRREQVKEILAQIAIEINVMAWVVSCSTYLQAKTPLVKLQIDPLISYYETKRKYDYCIYHPQLHQYLDIKDRKKAKNISLDLSISLQPSPFSPSTELMRSYLNNNSFLQRIILIVKYILATKGYNKNFSGGLGSYCLFIMIAAYFQQHTQCMQKDQGEVLLDVLKFYSQEFQNLITSITLRDNASCYISLEESLTMSNFSQHILSNPLRIIDPLTQKLTSSSCSQYHLIKQQFRRIRTQILAHLQSIHEQVLPNFTQKSMKTEGLDKNIEKLVHKSQARRKGWLKRLIEGKNQTR